MAILSSELKLKDGIWQELITPCVAQQFSGGNLEVVNADSLPVGDIIEAQTMNVSDNLSFNAPASGSLYVRVKHGAGSVKYYEV